MIVGLIVGFLARSWFSILAMSLAAPVVRLGYFAFAGGTTDQAGYAAMVIVSYLSSVAVGAAVYGLRLAFRATSRASH